MLGVIQPVSQTMMGITKIKHMTELSLHPALLGLPPHIQIQKGLQIPAIQQLFISVPSEHRLTNGPEKSRCDKGLFRLTFTVRSLQSCLESKHIGEPTNEPSTLEFLCLLDSASAIKMSRKHWIIYMKSFHLCIRPARL